MLWTIITCFVILFVWVIPRIGHSADGDYCPLNLLLPINDENPLESFESAASELETKADVPLSK